MPSPKKKYRLLKKHETVQRGDQYAYELPGFEINPDTIQNATWWPDAANEGFAKIGAKMSELSNERDPRLFVRRPIAAKATRPTRPTVVKANRPKAAKAKSRSRAKKLKFNSITD